MIRNRNETSNHIISQCSNQAQAEYKSKHDWMGKVIHWEGYKKLKFDPTDKGYIHKSEPVQETEMHKILWDFEIQTDHEFLDKTDQKNSIDLKKFAVI